MSASATVRRPLVLLVTAGAIAVASHGPAGAVEDQLRTEIAGHCDPAPALEGMLRRNDGSTEILNISCDRMLFGILPEVTGYPGETRAVAFLRDGNYALRFIGRFSDHGDFTVASVRIGEAAAVPVSRGARCRFYARGEAINIAICFARFQQGGRNLAAVVAFTATR